MLWRGGVVIEREGMRERKEKREKEKVEDHEILQLLESTTQSAAQVPDRAGRRCGARALNRLYFTVLTRYRSNSATARPHLPTDGQPISKHPSNLDSLIVVMREDLVWQKRALDRASFPPLAPHDRRARLVADIPAGLT
ncbi:hypothetical protein EVAR_87906_1 [Eumeta japonica]|uniref:Uncharacterized protein n=1 Tax=Eumeta variegata TaxID=151549 RepID=A0A4C1WVA6_EUMVA|nr:hypothetical protein EVAR_87906_1 [Eumeta japonica]